MGTAFLALGLGLPTRLCAGDPAYYQKQGTWHETMVASVVALAQAGIEAGCSPFESEVMRGGEPARRVAVDVRGARRLHLLVTGDPDKIWGVANWADPRLIDAAGQAHPLTTLTAEGPGRAALDWTVRKGRHDININLHSGLYEPLRIGGRQFARGIHVQADSEIVVALEGRFAQFEAWIGMDDWARTQGSVRFRVLGPRAAAVEQMWDLLARDFPQGRPRQEMRWEQLDGIWTAAWTGFEARRLAARYAGACVAIPPLAEAAARAAEEAETLADLAAVRAVYLRARELRTALAQAQQLDLDPLRLALEDLRDSFGSAYPGGTEYLRRWAELERALPVAIETALDPKAPLEQWVRVETLVGEFRRLEREALLGNPLLDFDRLLVIKRRPKGEPRSSQWADRGPGEYVGMPRQSSWGLGTMPNVDDWENELAVLAPVEPEGRLATLFRPPGRRLVTDVDLHWDADRMLISLPDAANRWQVQELTADGRQLRQLTPSEHPDVHHYDACYLPNGQIAFISTAPLQGVPCNAGVIVGMMYLMDGDGRNIRQICFEQDHDYTPSVLNDGRVLYLRWDYTDTPHVWNRVLMSMNPDGTTQAEVYGSNSYWPNAIFFARAVPGHPTKLAGIVTGHHEGRVGELVVFDPARGRHEAQGVVQRIPGRGRPVAPVIEDKPTEHSWPKFLHPWPLNEHYYLVACKPSPDALWGIYLADVFDNLVLVREEEGYALLEPIPFRATPPPPVIPNKTKPDQRDALVYVEDVYRGPGLRGVPRGTVKRLRVFAYHFGFQKMAGIDHRVGTDGPWEIKRVLGSVPVEPDGSALFHIPAKTPVSLQPLDGEGRALALMRSWLTAQPGEVLSCVGCHDRPGTAPINLPSQALRRKPSPLEASPGSPRGFSFARDVQPVLDRYCVGCHDGQARPAGEPLVDLRSGQGVYLAYQHGQPTLRTVRAASPADLLGKYAGVFELAYIALRELVRVGGLESDLHVLPPLEFHANTSELIQMLDKGHHNVRLDAESWERLVTWIDLNAPCHGTWSEVTTLPIPNQVERRRLLRQLYGGVDEDCEAVVHTPRPAVAPVLPEPLPRQKLEMPRLEGWPFDAAQARSLQAAAGPRTRELDLGEGVTLALVRIPAGRFVMGDPEGERDEQPLAVVEVPQPFWMARFEITNEQYRRFDPAHDSRFEHRSSWIFDESYLGWPLNASRQPVVRVSWNEAMAFCRWLSQRLGERVALPTEAQWEYACRAGTATPLAYGDLDTDFARHANLADQTIRKLAEEGWRPKAPDLAAREARFNDGVLVTADVGRYEPNAWGLHDLHGNAAEWTRSSYRPYPWDALATEEPALDADLKVVRGGSWRDRPKRARSAFRLSYPAYQKVFNVGFRIIVEDRMDAELALKHPRGR